MKYTDKEREQIEIIQARVLANYGRKITEREAVTIGLTMAADCFVAPTVRILDLNLIRQFMVADEFVEFQDYLNDINETITKGLAAMAQDAPEATQSGAPRKDLH